MASSRSSYMAARKNYRFLDRTTVTPAISSPENIFELDESDLWNVNTTPAISSPEYRTTPFPSSRRRGSDLGGKIASSVPVNVPDWSKILRDDFKENRWRENDFEFDGEDDEFDDGGNRIPPHEFLSARMMRTRIASFSVHEGIGRTLKGRDLSRVRNAIWKKTGFQD